MEYRVVVPPLGESVVEGTIVKWLKNEGDTVKVDDPLVEIMTDKINIEIPSPYAGIMKKHLAIIDTVDEIGQEIAVMDVEGEVTETKTFATSSEPGKEKIPQEQEAPIPAAEFTEAAAHHRDEGIHAN